MTEAGPLAIGEIGHIALILAFLASLVQSVVPLIGTFFQDVPLMKGARPGAVLIFGLVSVAFGILMYSFVVSDFSMALVAQHSHSDKPLLYRISATWGQHEGSLLLWVLVLNAFSAMLALFGRTLPLPVCTRVLSVQSLLSSGFLALCVFLSNPFERLDPAPINGQGLNPLLQDPGLAFHPPMLYVGYVGFSVAFSFAIAALLEGRVDALWARWVRPWILVAWSTLTLGIGLGSWWAYYELGWGGWWFWDPVENASLIPWLLGTALVHSVCVLEKRDTLKHWVVLLAIVTFGASLLGTFLVRSGILTSVHSFAADPGRGIAVLVLLGMFVGGGLLLYAARAPLLRNRGMFAPLSRESGLLLNNALMCSAAMTVLLGTLYPLVLDALDMGKISVGAPFFNQVFLPLMAPVFLIMGLGPLLPWKRADMGGVFARLKVAALLMCVVGAIPWMIKGEGISSTLLASCGFSAATWVTLGTLTAWWDRLKPPRMSVVELGQRMRHMPKSVWGMTLAHLGVACLIVGVTGSSVYQQEAIQNHQIGETVQVGPRSFLLSQVSMGDGPNYDSLFAEIVISENGQAIGRTYPEKRAYRVPQTTTTEVGLHQTQWTDIYTVLGDPVPGTPNAFVTRIYIKPLTSFLWYGAVLMALGGILSACDRRRSRNPLPPLPSTGSSSLDTSVTTPKRQRTPHMEEA